MWMRRGFLSCAICAVTGLVATAVDADAQAPVGLKRTIVQKTDVPGGNYVSILVEAEIDPHFAVARHTHPGIELRISLKVRGSCLSKDSRTARSRPAKDFKSHRKSRTACRTAAARRGWRLPTSSRKISLWRRLRPSRHIRQHPRPPQPRSSATGVAGVRSRA